MLIYLSSSPSSSFYLRFLCHFLYLCLLLCAYKQNHIWHIVSNSNLFRFFPSLPACLSAYKCVMCMALFISLLKCTQCAKCSLKIFHNKTIFGQKVSINVRIFMFLLQYFRLTYFYTACPFFFFCAS